MPHPNSEHHEFHENYYFSVGGRRRELVGVLPASSAGHDGAREAVLQPRQDEPAPRKVLVLNRSSSATTTTVILAGGQYYCLMLSARRQSNGKTAIHFPAQHELLPGDRCHATAPLHCGNETQLFELRRVDSHRDHRHSIHAVFADGTRSAAIEVHPVHGRLVVPEEGHERHRLVLNLPTKEEEEPRSTHIMPIIGGFAAAVLVVVVMLRWR